MQGAMCRGAVGAGRFLAVLGGWSRVRSKEQAVRSRLCSPVRRLKCGGPEGGSEEANSGSSQRGWVVGGRVYVADWGVMCG